jgi:hypothetical protein
MDRVREEMGKLIVQAKDLDEHDEIKLLWNAQRTGEESYDEIMAQGKLAEAAYPDFGLNQELKAY